MLYVLYLANLYEIYCSPIWAPTILFNTSCPLLHEDFPLEDVNADILFVIQMLPDNVHTLIRTRNK